MIKQILFLLFLGISAFAQHGVEITWGASPDAGATYNVYRLLSTCPASGTTGFTKVNTAPITTLTYFDPNPEPPGPNANICYYVTATALPLAESVPSPFTTLVFLPSSFPPGPPNAVIK